MRPLVHPAAEDVTIEGLLYALADPVRLKIFADIMAAESPVGCTPYLQVGEKRSAKSTISQHFKVLRESGLIRSERRGPGLISASRWEELEPRFGPMIEALLAAYRREHARTAKAAARRAKTPRTDTAQLAA